MRSIVRKIGFYGALELFRLLPYPLVIRLLKLDARLRYRLKRSWRTRAIAWLSENAPCTVSAEHLRAQAQELITFIVFFSYLRFLLFLKHPQEQIEARGWERVESALKLKKGVILLSSHTGFAWAERPFFLSRRPDILYLHLLRVAGPDDQSLRARLLRWRRRRFGLDRGNLIGNEGFSLQYMKKAFNHLRNNGIVNLTGDGLAGTGRRYPVTICGRHRTLPAGGISLGRISGATILPVFTSMHTRGELPRFQIEIQEPLRDPVGLCPAEQTRTLVEAYAARVDGFVKRHPENVYLFPVRILDEFEGRL